MTAAPAVAPPPGATVRRRTRGRRDWAGPGFVAPAVGLAAVFLLLPLVLAFVYSFAEIAPLSGETTWIGFENYAAMVTDPTFYRSALNTAIFTIATVPGSMAIGLAFAVLMNSVLPGRRIVRTVIYLPLVISGVAVGLIGTFLYNETVGVFDQILQAIGLPAVPWQSNGPAAFLSVVLITLWIRVGFNMIIYLAGLQAVPTELYEASQTEGATGWQRFRHITLPLLGPSSFFLLIMNVIYSFQVFDTIYVLTNGGPGSATEVLGTYAYKTAFGPARDQGYGAALGVVIFLLTLAFTIVQWRNSRTRDEVA